MHREDVARRMLLAALKVVHPIAGLAQQAQWLRDMAQGLDLANMRTEGAGNYGDSCPAMSGACPVEFPAMEWKHRKTAEKHEREGERRF